MSFPTLLQIPYKGFEHGDFMNAVEAPALVYDGLRSQLREFAKTSSSASAHMSERSIDFVAILTVTSFSRFLH